MRKFILFFVLLVLFLAFGVLFIKAFLIQKNYFNNKTNQTSNQINSISYSKEDYDKAINDKKILVLFFTANWCQECLSQEIVNTEVFSELNSNNVVGLKIHILDSETTTETNALAQKFDITKEQSFVILDKNGVVYFKYTGEINKNMLKNKILDIIK